MSDMQAKPMLYDPATGKKYPKPNIANGYRLWHGKVAWLYNPWSGKPRDPRDIGSDVFGHLIDGDTF